MKVMVIVKATAQSEAGLLPDANRLDEMAKFNSQLAEAGILESAEGLLPSSNGARIHFSGISRGVTKGPFASAGELIAGFWIWRVKSLEEAIEWAKRCPNPMPTDCDIEIRPLMEQETGETTRPDTYEHQAAAKAHELGLTVRFETSKEMHIAGLKQTYMFASRNSIPLQWRRFVPYIGQVAGQVGKSAYGVCSNYSANDGFDYMSGVEVSQTSSLPPEFSSLHLPTQRYAVFAHTDDVSKIPETIDAVWRQWLPASGLKPAGSPCFEKYTEQFNSQTGRGGIEIWVPVQNA